MSLTGDYATSRAWPVEFPVKTFLTYISLSLFALFSHVVAEGKEEEENMREKGEANPIMRDHHQYPTSTGYLPKALLPNTNTLAVKGGHNSIHSIA